MARRKHAAAAEAGQSTSAPVDETPVTNTNSSTPEQPPADRSADAINAFPRNIKTAVLGEGYKIRLNQDGPSNELRIQFGSGMRADKPSDAVLDIIRSQLVPEHLKTSTEKAEGKDVPWFKFKGDPDTGEGSWRMWIAAPRRNVARSKAEQVFAAVVQQVAKEIGAGPAR